MINRIMAASAVTACAVTLAACGSSSSAGKSTRPSSSLASRTTAAAATRSPTAARSSMAPATWTMQEARAKYLAYVAPGNKLIAKFNHLATGSIPISRFGDIRRVCGRMVTAEDRFARDLVAGRWPASVAPKVDALVTAVTRERSDWQTCTTATTSQQMQSFLDGMYDGSPQAEAVRIALGLPGTGTPAT